MKTIQILIITMISLAQITSCQQDLLVSDYKPGDDNLQSNPNHPMKDSLHILLTSTFRMGFQVLR